LHFCHPFRNATVGARRLDPEDTRPHIASGGRLGRSAYPEEGTAMADVPAPVNTSAANPPIGGALLAYILMGIGAAVALVSSGFPMVAPLMGLAGIAGVVVCYVKRGDAEGTWVASHLRWLIRTFWYSLLWGMIGAAVLLLLGLVLIGIPIAIVIWVVASLWVIYRVIRGYLIFNQHKPIPGM
jgi:uncharacterized membrane protein